MMQELSIFEELDAVLEFVVRPSTDSIIYERVVDNHVWRENLLTKLEKDGYVNRTYKKSDSKDSDVAISIDGKILLANGGYVKRHELDLINATLAEKDKERMIRNERLIIAGTWVASIVAALLLIWQVYSYYYPLPSQPCTINKIYKK